MTTPPPPSRTPPEPPAHDWAMGWPGNYCKRCGLDDFMESAIVCPDCYVPCCDEEMEHDPVMRLCPEHQAWADTPCAAGRPPMETR